MIHVPNGSYSLSVYNPSEEAEAQITVTPPGEKYVPTDAYFANGAGGQIFGIILLVIAVVFTIFNCVWMNKKKKAIASQVNDADREVNANYHRLNTSNDSSIKHDIK